ncbi:hypothetical protein U0035_02805 [Niabella yanshanensis]|uniref:Intradiol ring-cleavage dioxygenases domain-containing protein n=1 Tax=Niabella yanshanensis TaxID=577386 RepID=A0ABZ0W7F8_9BACT|nr:intradiol ring-cleavage dioxygenase [Niabella yanshanensis]WQD39076.1 hypothetical protein U0035_02805 [Niabella yanshanensis]
MKKWILELTTALCSLVFSCGSPVKPSAPKTGELIGGGCDGCELMYVNLPEQIASADSSPAWNGEGQPLKISGTVLKADGKTPAPDVIIYYWQTDNEGHYANLEGLDPRAKRHGYIRGWLKTGTDGRYALYTIRPAPYPNDSLPAHIHLSIKEPKLPNEYYTDEINFDDDPLLKPYFKKHPPEHRGGSGVVRVKLQGSLQEAEHDIELGKNIPGYPGK